jgi:haloalkane dehalogenase
VAHDWGGAIGMGTAVQMPDRFARIVLMNTAAFRSPKCPLRIHVCRIPFLGRLGVQGLNLFAGAAVRMAVSDSRRMTKEVKSGLLAPYNSWKNRLAIYRFVKDIPLSEKHPSYPVLLNIEQNLSRFRDIPVAFIWGMRDWCFTPDFLKRFLQFFPDAEVHRFNDAGHYVVEDAFEEIVSILENFLAK